MSINDDLTARLRATFLAELTEQVKLLNRDVLALEAEPTAAEPLRAVFRSMHSLKGAASAAAVPEVERVCHELESLLAVARAGKLRLGAEQFALLFAGADALTDAAARLQRGEALTGSALDVLHRRLIAGTAQDTTTTADTTTSRPADPPAEPAQAPAPPSVEPPQSAAPPAPTAAAPPAPKAAAPPTPKPQTARAMPTRAGETRVRTERLDELMAVTGELLVANARVQDLPASLREVERAASDAVRAWRQVQPVVELSMDQSGAPTAAREAIQEVGQAVNRVAGLAHMLVQTRAGEARALGRTTRALADQVRRLRMRPFAEACEALPRAVRDLAVSSNKEVTLRIEGKEVEADRTVLDALAEVLLQLVRNAVDHGIETQSARTAAGKPAEGTVTVAAALRGERLHVRVTDDGAGVDIAAIRAELDRRGATMPDSDSDVLQVLLEAGISTRPSVTRTSGRGVGLDIANTGMTRIRGRVEVSTTPGAGTTFLLECPPTLASVHALLVRVGTQTLALPISAVVRVARVRPEEIRRAEGRDVIASNGSPVPLVALAPLLGPAFTDSPFTGTAPIVVIGHNAHSVALRVGELISEQELIVRPLDEMAESPPHVSGAALLATGGVALLLNAFTLIDAARNVSSTESAAQPEATAVAVRRVLVVDDSITTRTLEQSILEAAGYEVSTAVDGADAWRILQENGAELVVSDVEMPQVDGFGLCRLIRASKRFRDLPVILVSALESMEHRQRGLEVGADAYLGKSSFDQQNLLDLVQQLIGRGAA